MKSRLLIVSTALIALPVLGGGIEERAAASRATAQQFMETLKESLQQAMKQGDPVHAIEVCKTRAPIIAKDISEHKGWRVARTSLRVRNPANAPDPWEEAVLKRFEARKAKGEDPKKLEYYEVVQQGDRQVFRYMKAIPTAELCLKCHGSRLDRKVQAKLKEIYPNDQAKGFKVGDIRGAFTITQPM